MGKNLAIALISSMIVVILGGMTSLALSSDDLTDQQKQLEIQKLVDNHRSALPTELVLAIICQEGGEGAFQIDGWDYNNFYSQNDGPWAQPTNGDGIMQVTTASGHHEKCGPYTHDQSGYDNAINDGCDYLLEVYGTYETYVQTALHYNTGPNTLYIYLGRNWGDRNYLSNVAAHLSSFVPNTYGLQNQNLVESLNQGQSILDDYLYNRGIETGQSLDYYSQYQVQLDNDLNNILDSDSANLQTDLITLTLYVHEGSASGPVIPGALITGNDGSGNSFQQTTDNSGYVIIEGNPGTWSFSVSSAGYETSNWDQDINEDDIKDAFLQQEQDQDITLTLYIHDGSASGPIIPDAQVTGWDGSGNSFEKTSSSSGYVTIAGFPGIWSFSVSADGYETNSWDQEITETDTKDAYLQKSLLTLEGHSRSVTSIDWSPDGRTLASGSEDNTVKLWDIAANQELRTLEGHSGGIRCVAWSPDGLTLASGSYDNTVKLWDVVTGRELGSHDVSSYVNDLAFSPDGRTLALAVNEEKIKLWDVQTGNDIGPLEGHITYVSRIAFSPDGQKLASGSADDTVKLWDIATGREIHSFEVGTTYKPSVAFSPDGRTLASASNYKNIILWDVQTGREIRTLEAHSEYVFDIEFSPDGQTLASAGDYAIKLWDVTTGLELSTINPGDWKSCIAWSPDGHTLASGDSTIKLWDVSY